MRRERFGESRREEESQNEREGGDRLLLREVGRGGGAGGRARGVSHGDNERGREGGGAGVRKLLGSWMREATKGRRAKIEESSLRDTNH